MSKKSNYELSVTSTFSAAHNLRGYKDKCEKLHGHNWKVELAVRGNRLNGIGLLLDFKILKERLKSILEGLDHTHLNDLPHFKKVNPSSENIAKFIYKQASKLLNSGEITVSAVSVRETDSSCAVYRE